MAKKYYAVKEGFDSKTNQKVENLLVSTWDECKRLVTGVKGAKYKSFERLEDAKEYLREDKKLLKKGVDVYPEDWLHAYVDGSYNTATGKFSYALTVVKNNVIQYVENGAAQDTSQKQIRQIAGELKGAVRGVEYAVTQGEKKLVIFHDYEGIYHHAVGTWERNDASSKQYYETMNGLIEKNGLEVVFVKVDSHTGDIYNEVTDSLAKKAIGIALTDAVDKWLGGNRLAVVDDDVWEKLIGIVKFENRERIEVVENGTAVVVEKEDDFFETVKVVYGKSKEGADSALEFVRGLDGDYKDRMIVRLVEELVREVRDDK